MRLTPRQLALLTLGGALALFCALSVHVVMLDRLHVAYPSRLPSVGIGRLPDRILRVVGVIALYRLAPPRWRSSPLRGGVALWLLLLAVNEELIRGPLMNAVNLSGATAYPFLDALPQDVTAAVVVGLIIACRRWLSSVLGVALLAVSIAVLAYDVVLPLAKAAYSPIGGWTAAREGRVLYNPPYDWHIQIPAYITFVEPVIAGLLIAAAVARNLPRQPWAAWASLALLIFALRGLFFSVFTYIPISGTDPVSALLSVGQFSLENLVLSVMLAATWVLAAPPRPAHQARSL